MEGTRTTKSVTNKVVGNTAVQQEEVASTPVMDKQEFGLAKVNQFLWYIGHFIAILLTLRFLFLLLGANLTGIARFIYDISSVFVFPFRGIFPSATAGESFFDPASVLGIVMYYLLILILTHALKLFSKKVEA